MISLTPVDTGPPPGWERANAVKKIFAEHRFAQLTCTLTVAIAKKKRQLGTGSAKDKDKALSCFRDVHAKVVADMLSIANELGSGRRNDKIPMIWVASMMSASVLASSPGDTDPS